MTPRATLNAELQRIDLRLRAMESPTPDPHGDAADQMTARQGQEDLVVERARLLETRACCVAALIRLEERTYGDCLECLEPIGEKRLAAIPWARRCLSCETTHERTARDGTVRHRPDLDMAPDDEGYR